MNLKNSRIILEDQQRDFLYDKNKSNLRISFNRISGFLGFEKQIPVA